MHLNVLNLQWGNTTVWTSKIYFKVLFLTFVKYDLRQLLSNFLLLGTTWEGWKILRPFSNKIVVGARQTKSQNVSVGRSSHKMMTWDFMIYRLCFVHFRAPIPLPSSKNTSNSKWNDSQVAVLSWQPNQLPKEASLYIVVGTLYPCDLNHNTGDSITVFSVLGIAGVGKLFTPKGQCSNALRGHVSLGMPGHTWSITYTYSLTHSLSHTSSWLPSQGEAGEDQPCSNQRSIAGTQ